MTPSLAAFATAAAVLGLFEVTPAATAGQPHILYKQGKAGSCGGDLVFRGGDVMPSFTAYLIFWLPPGVHFSSTVGDANYESLITRYFQDVGGSAFYNIVTQYGGTNGVPSSAVAVGGSVVDINPYPKAGTLADPLLDSDLQTEIANVITTQGWPTGPAVMFFVFTGNAIQSCDIFPTSCTNNVFCAYHSAFTMAGQPVIYANMPDAFSLGGCGNSNVTGDASADTEINTLSHEHFEAVTDPGIDPLGGWYDSAGCEIGDKCAYNYGPAVPPGTPNVVLNTDPYFVQQEWSNQSHQCALSFSAAPVSSGGIPVAPPWGLTVLAAGFLFAGAWVIYRRTAGQTQRQPRA